ncbi:Transcriptional repressor of arabinoside utilization operon GntR family [Lactococcus cremoris]|uniref:Transcriptional repressor of arabinoside utilization operon GntR family n=1 Tax=Lactococcus lactis subsp. cremoris TaxID=1359 RepID=A0A166IYR6_LACLC|nr:LacI family DNA-binding transcriptional regulator [Lactococcus cremoris]KZK05250.1 Transcriptional repressor of arabinoside utilization operon GntR family [Lactococcus cremoris]
MSLPLYQQISDDLKQKIITKIFKSGDQLPTEKELSETYSVSRITAKRALTDLEQLGLVSRTRGKGTFVQELNKNHTKLLKRVLFIIPFEGMSFGDFTHGLVPALKVEDTTVFITYASYLKENTADDIKENFDGLIYYPMYTEDYLDILLELSLQNFPVVLLDKQIYDLGFPCVSSDNFNGGEQAAQALLELGHKRIAFVASNDSHHPQTTRNRYLGYVKVLKEQGIRFHTTLDDSLYTESSVLELIQNEEVTGLICENDLVALQTMKTLQNNHFDIPNDISIIGFDDIQAASLSNPPLTTIAQDFIGMGRIAGELLLDWIKNGETPKDVKVPINLIKRNTTEELK